MVSVLYFMLTLVYTVYCFLLTSVYLVIIFLYFMQFTNLNFVSEIQVNSYTIYFILCVILCCLIIFYLSLLDPLAKVLSDHSAMHDP